MQRIRYFPQATVDKLKHGIGKNLAWYRGKGVDVPFDDTYREMSVGTEADFSCFDTLNENCADTDDLNNTLAFYKTFKCLTPQQASDERIWTYLTHVQACKYTKNRWNEIPRDDGKAVTHIQNHYFADSPRQLISRNAVARLWWMGHIASRRSDYDLKKTLKILLRLSDVRSSLLERPTQSGSPEIFKGVIRILGKSGEKDPEPTIYKRANFRAFMKKLNQRGGRLMLNALPPQRLNAVLEEIACEAITSSNN